VVSFATSVPLASLATVLGLDENYVNNIDAKHFGIQGIEFAQAIGMLRSQAPQGKGLSMDTTTIIILAVVVVLVVGAGAWAMMQRRSQELRERFGPEYDRVLSERGDARQAESELAARQKRVDKLEIHPIEPEQREHFIEAWRSTQARFVDAPPQAIKDADRLVSEVMQARGYPVGDFEQRAADVSVDHPIVVENYRAARAIALANERGQASTEDLRQAIVHYRALFEDLLETREREVAR
jgi:hypothetical protein